MNILEMKHVKKAFGETGVLKDISLDVREGDVVSIIGPSGSGKSTLLRCATYLETMDDGSIEYIGNDTVQPFGLVFQNFNLFPHFSGAEEIQG